MPTPILLCQTHNQCKVDVGNAQYTAVLGSV